MGSFQVANLKAELTKASNLLASLCLTAMAACPTTFSQQVSLPTTLRASLHVAAAAAYRGNTASGGTGCCDNQVMARNTADKKTCAQICAQTAYRNCDAEVSIYGKKGKATKN